MVYELINKNQDKSLPVFAQVLLNRGIKYEDINHYLRTSDDDILPAELIKNMDKGMLMLAKHLIAGNKIFIQVDSDADGYCSSAILLNYLHRLYPDRVENNIIYRLQDGKEHGVFVETVPKDVKLVIIPDAGSNQYEEHQELVAKGIDVLVIDHHEAETESADACIINNQLCNYPTKSLCGGAMVYKFCAYWDSIMGTDYAKDYYDLAALALISDMMDIRDFETRHLITLGLNNINNPFFKAMIEKQAYSLSDGLSPIGIAFYITPYINATVRMGSNSEKELMFEAMLEYLNDDLIPSTKRGCSGQKETRAEQACRNCMTIKRHQGSARDEQVEAIEEQISSSNLLDNKILLIQMNEKNVNKNLTGLIANQLMSKYQRPVLLLSYDETTNLWSGSARNYDKSNFKTFKDFINSSNYAAYAEGHQAAFGVGIAEENLPKLISYANRALKDYDFSPSYKVDFIVDGNDFDGKDILEIAKLKNLWGQNMSEPYIAIERIKITKDNITLMSPDKSPTLKITLSNGTCLIKFKSSKEEYEKLKQDVGCNIINIVGTCNSNTWNGSTTPQIFIEDYEIVGEIKYYF